MAISPWDSQVIDRLALTYGPNNAPVYGKELATAGQTFINQFTNLVGREPTQVELNQYYTDFAVQNKLLTNPGNTMGLSDATKTFISDNYQRAAEEQAKQELLGQQTEANRLADLFRTQGTAAINSTEQSLLDYQQRLFEKLRPNLITSLQAQGLLNTGGLNEAVAGAQSDLAAAGSEELRQQRLANEMGANEIAFGGASAPYQFAQANSMNRLPFLQQQGQGAMNRSYQTFLTNLNFQNQLALQKDARGGGKGGFLQQIGNSFAPSFGSQLGQNFANFAIPNYTQTSSNPYTGMSTSKSGLAALFG